MDSGQQLVIERACEQLPLAYAYHLDFGNYDALAKLFAPEGTLQLGRAPLQGQDAIRAGVLERYQGQVTRHICSNVMIDVIDEQRAVGIAYVTIYRHHYDGAEPSGEIGIRGPTYVGHFEDEFVSQHGGWRFASRRLNVRFRRSRRVETAT